MKFYLIKFLHIFSSKMPLNILLLLAYPLGLLYYIFSPLNNFKIRKRKKLLPGYSLIRVKINYVKYWLETIWLTKEGYKKYVFDNVEIVNEEKIRKLNKNYNSFIIALPHLGNWEFAIPMGKVLDLNLLAVAEPLADQKILKWFTNLREDLGCKILLGGKGQNIFNNLIDHLDSGFHVCLLSERHIGKSGVGVEFFTQLAAFPKGPVALSLKTQKPIIPAAFLKIKGVYKLVFGNPFIVPFFENDGQSIQQGLKVLSKSMEELILLDPNQWHSIQPVWSSEY